jgi:methylthioribose-1-phosphate isomerase
LASEIRTVYWEDGKVLLIDQTRIPEEFSIIAMTDYRDVAEAIREMKVRGAPAIGVTAALGIALGAQRIETCDSDEFCRAIKGIADEFAGTRPTAVNLFWAIDRMLGLIHPETDSVEVMRQKLLDEALRILEEDIEINKRLGSFGVDLIKDGDTVLTHCNAGALATAGFGTALGVIRAAAAAGKRVQVIADETRPRLQGMRLTAWELSMSGIPVTLITDSMAAWAMSKGMVNLVIVGADRIAANGDTANKVGTYGVAVLAKAHNIPFYVAAPFSTIDFSIPDGSHIPIEERDASEVTHIGGRRIAPEDVHVLNPAFDVTPSKFITAFITECGIIEPVEIGKMRDKG